MIMGTSVSWSEPWVRKVGGRASNSVARSPEDGLLVAEDDQLADPVGHQVESVGGFPAGQDGLDTLEAPDASRWPAARPRAT